VLYLEF